MIYKHKFIKQAILENKQVRKVSQQQPMIVIVEDNQFLHYTVSTAFAYLGIPHLITTLRASDLEESRKNMGHQVPNLVYSNQVLQTVQLVEFLCDAFIDDQQFIDFESRKAVIKELVVTWKQIFIFQRLYPYAYEKLSKLGVRNQKDYKNLIHEQLQQLINLFVGKVLQRAYAGYSQEQISLENIIFVDIIETILNRVPQSYADYALRRIYFKLIEHHERLKRIIKLALPKYLLCPHQIILQQPINSKPTMWTQFQHNATRFLIVFGFMGTMYSIFAKP